MKKAYVRFLISTALIISIAICSLCFFCISVSYADNSSKLSSSVTFTMKGWIVNSSGTAINGGVVYFMSSADATQQKHSYTDANGFFQISNITATVDFYGQIGNCVMNAVGCSSKSLPITPANVYGGVFDAGTVQLASDADLTISGGSNHYIFDVSLNNGNVTTNKSMVYLVYGESTLKHLRGKIVNVSTDGVITGSFHPSDSYNIDFTIKPIPVNGYKFDQYIINGVAYKGGSSYTIPSSGNISVSTSYSVVPVEYLDSATNSPSEFASDTATNNSQSDESINNTATSDLFAVLILTIFSVFVVVSSVVLFRKFNS